MTISLLVTALILGVRHGLDVDHIAAILDLTSAPRSTRASNSSAVATVGCRRAIASPLPGIKGRPALLGTMYAIGHAAVVATLGILALAFGAILPDWFDAMMGRIVGVTLIALGAWVLVSVAVFARKGGEFHWRSRWMLAYSSARRAWSWARRKPPSQTPLPASAYAPVGALAIGVVHGVGAETATQVVVISGVAGTGGDAAAGVAMLGAFILGMLASNTGVIAMLTLGASLGSAARPVTILAGLAAGVLSIFVGSVFLAGLDFDSVFAFVL